MLCDKCMSNEACFHFTLIVNGEAKQVNLCESCAYKLRENYAPEDFFGFTESTADSDEHSQNQKSGAVCGVCGLTSEKYIETGLLGCENCYEVFDELIEPVLLKVNGRSDYITGDELTSISLLAEIKGFRKKLNCAIENEDFEAAAKFRDKIKELIHSSAEKSNV